MQSPAVTQPPRAVSPPQLSAPAHFTSQQVEIGFTAVTLVAMLAALALQKAAAPNWAPSTLYLIAYLTGGYFGTIAAFQSLRQRTIDIDLLMILAALGAAYIGAPFEGAMLLFLFSLSNVLQDYALGRTKQAIRALMKLRPNEARLLRDGQNSLVPVDQLVVGDIVLIRPGERVPLDGEVARGRSTLDQSSLTGESFPVSKDVGDTVFAGTINGSGALEVRITKLAKDSTIAKLIRLVEEAQSERAPTQRFMDRFEQWYAMGVIGGTLAMIALPVWILSQPFDDVFYRAMTLMVVASPCALVISTPASILSAIANGARRGVLFKGGAHLENAANIQIVALDKTGTLTYGKPQVTDVTVIPLLSPEVPGWCGEEENLLALAAAIEHYSEHPLAQAIVAAAQHRGIEIPDAEEFVSTTGKGVRAHIGGVEIGVGNPRFFADLKCAGLTTALKDIERLQDEGKTSVLVGLMDSVRREAQILGVIAIADVVREDSVEVVRALKKAGVKKVVMLTGDNTRVAAAVARQTGVDEYFADLLPEGKVRIVKELKAGGAVAMVGDGVNDAPALAVADMGVAMGAAGTDVALETADVVLMGDDLRHIPYAIELSRAARRVVVQNLSFAVAVIVLLIFATLGWHLPLPLGVIGHEGSTVLVCLNGLRLLAFRTAPGERNIATRSTPTALRSMKNG